MTKEKISTKESCIQISDYFDLYFSKAQVENNNWHVIMLVS